MPSTAVSSSNLSRSHAESEMQKQTLDPLGLLQSGPQTSVAETMPEGMSVSQCNMASCVTDRHSHRQTDLLTNRQTNKKTCGRRRGSVHSTTDAVLCRDTLVQFCCRQGSASNCMTCKLWFSVPQVPTVTFSFVNGCPCNMTRM